MIEHDVSVYDNDPYEKENLLSMSNYVNLIDKYSSDKSSFLELGIGHSKTIELLSQKFENVTVLDGEKELVNKYNKIYSKIEFVEIYFENFNTDKLYKNIGMGFVLEHVNNPEEILKKYSKFLEPNGKIFISVPNANSLHRIIANKAGLLEDIKMLSETDKRYGHLRFLTYFEWVSLFEKCNMEIEVSHGLFLKPFTTQQIHSLNLDNIIYNSLGSTAHLFPEISNSCFFILKNKKD